MRVLAFRHGPFEHLGWIGDTLEEHEVGCDYIDLYRASGADLPLANADALILMGGTMSANDDLPYIHRELLAIQQAIAAAKPVLGVCLGAQLIAKALGAKVYKNAVKEIGWAPVTFTAAAQRDPLFRGLRDSETIFHWHSETFDLPEGAHLLASSEACCNQAFRAGDLVYGLQFHLEASPAMIAQWCAEDANGELREVTEPLDPYARTRRMKELARLVFGRWCVLAKGQHSACGASL